MPLWKGSVTKWKGRLCMPGQRASITEFHKLYLSCSVNGIKIVVLI